MSPRRRRFTRQCERKRWRTSSPRVRGCAMEQWQGQETLLRRLGKAFHFYADDIAHEPLPRRWVDLIRYLDDRERKSLERRQPAGDGEASLTKGDVAVRSQEKVLRELMHTDEPTEEATALLKDLRRKVADALARRH